MNIRKTRITALILAAGLSGTAQATLQGRDLNGSPGSFEAYYDTVLNITWLADANYAQTSGYDTDGRMVRDDANTWAANLSIVDSVNNIIYDNWRLPTVNPANGTTFQYTLSTNGSTDYGYNITSPNSELSYMFYVNLGNPGYVTPVGAVSGCYVSWPSNTCLENVGPFSNLQPNVYWYGSEYAPNTASAWVLTMYYGSQVASGSGIEYYAWAVSPGDVAAVPEPESSAMMIAGLGLLGFMARRRKKAEA